MFVQMKKFTVTEGNAHHLVEKFSQKGIIDEQPGIIDITVMVKKVRRGNEEVILQICWESEQDWKNWEKSEAHIAGHKASRGKPKPEFILETEGSLYHVETIKTPAIEAK